MKETHVGPRESALFFPSIKRAGLRQDARLIAAGAIWHNSTRATRARVIESIRKEGHAERNSLSDRRDPARPRAACGERGVSPRRSAFVGKSKL